MIEGVTIEIDPEAVLIQVRGTLRVLSSAVAGGGTGGARAIVNLHVGKDFHCDDAASDLAAFARRRSLPAPWVGLLTAALTEHAQLASEATEGITATAVVTVGLSNPVNAGVSLPAACGASTINTIVVVNATPEPAALVNLVVTATEAKVLALADAGFRGPGGGAVSGTSSDAILIAATDRGPRCRFGGPATALGWTVARAVRLAAEAGARRWIAEHP
ncbi:MAG: adenosylcobinamide amidohydrolase [Candidatus Rokubacteria bacterium]|nr:adenosylcobinamide amidohydrolase [Candidatus Rokubacteria bacterium]